MSFTSHTFTSLPLVHTLNPDFLRRQLWLCFLLVRECSRSGSLHAPWLPNLSSIISPNFADSRSSWLCRFKVLSLQEFATSGFSMFKTPSHRAFAAPRVRESYSPRIRDFETSWIPDSISSWVLCPWKLASQISLTSTFRGWRAFLNSPTLSGKQVDSDDSIPRTFRNFSKKRHPRNVRGDTRHPGTSQLSNRGTFAELPPLAPINKRLPLLKFFTTVLLCCEL
jgi:hypothetical protein